MTSISRRGVSVPARGATRILFEAVESRTLFASAVPFGPSVPSGLLVDRVTTPAIYNSFTKQIVSVSTKNLQQTATDGAALGNVFQPLTRIVAPAAGVKQEVNPSSYSPFTVSFDELKAQLRNAPLEFSAAAANPLRIAIPGPDGTLRRFDIVESPILSAEQSALHPEIKTYVGQGVDDRYATIRFDYTANGFHAQVRSPDGAWYIDPYWQFNTSSYVSYFKKDLVARPGQIATEILEADESLVDSATPAPADSGNTVANRTAGVSLRTFRLALAGTVEYTANRGGTPLSAFNAAVTAVNRVTGVYETELSVRFNLVTGSNLFYTGTDVYTNNNGSSMLSQNISNLSNVVGNANFDIGHVFSTGGGGVAYLGAVGNDSLKAGGVTGSPSPTGDAFYIDYVAHEMGHQMGGNHTFNGTQASLGGGNRNASTAYELGSGSTIQAYAGIGGSDDLQANSDAYFHAVSVDEILAKVASISAVGTTTNTFNTPPTVALPSNPVTGTNSFTIPLNTPFELTAVGTDANNDALTYAWEEWDLGPAAQISAAQNTTSPLFRGYAPVASATRVFPRIESLRTGATTTGNFERLPTLARDLKFRVTVRDNRAGGGGVTTSSVGGGVTPSVVTLSANVTGGGTFKITSQPSAVTYAGGSNQTVTWNVVGTNFAPFNAANVNILFSSDNGLTYTRTLASNVPNDGSETVQIPYELSTALGRIKVVPTNNVFFDINDAPVTVTFTSNLPATAAPGAPQLDPLFDTGAPGDLITNLNNTAGKTLKFVVPNTLPGASVQLFAGGVPISAVFPATGSFTEITTNGTATLPQAANAITARQTTTGNSVSPDSTALSITVDSIAPAVSAPDMTAATDTGTSTTDNTTASLTPQFQGTAETNASVQLLVDNVLVGTALTAFGGNYTLTAPTQTAGFHSYSVRATDVAGNVTTGASLSALIDNVSPTTGNLTTSVVAGATTGSVALTYSDPLSNVVASTIGTGDLQITGPNGYSQLVTFVTVNNTNNGTPRTGTYAFTAPGGTWDFTDNGTYTVSVVANQVLDVAGNAAVAGSVGTFAVAIPAPFAYMSGNTLVINGTTSADTLGLNVSGGDLVASLTGTGTLSFASGGVTAIQVNGLAGVDTFNFAGPVAQPVDLQLGAGASVLNVNSGALTIPSDASVNNGNLTVNVATGGEVLLSGTQHLADLNLAAGATATMGAGSNVLVVDNLQIAGGTVPTATLNLNDNDLVYKYSGSVGAKLSTLFAQVIAGRGTADANGLYAQNGFGVRTASGGNANESAGFNKYALGVIDNADLAAGAYTNFAGETLTGPALLVKYTYNGDANLNGRIDGSDYARVNASSASPPATPTWLNGDFNGDGLINADDYSTLDLGALTQNGIVIP